MSTLLGSRFTSRSDYPVHTSRTKIESVGAKSVGCSPVVFFAGCYHGARQRNNGLSVVGPIWWKQAGPIARSMVDKSFGLSCTCEQYRAVRASALIPTDLRASEAAARTAESPIEKAGQYPARRSLWSFFANKQDAATTGNTQHDNVGPSRWTRCHWSDRCEPGLVFFACFQRGL